MTARVKLWKNQKAKQAQRVLTVPKTHADREGHFLRLWRMLAPDKPEPVRQHMFCSTRKWRFDFAWIELKVAVEFDGGIYQANATGHRSISGIVNSMEKQNMAQVMGWKVLRFHANELYKTPAD